MFYATSVANEILFSMSINMSAHSLHSFYHRASVLLIFGLVLLGNPIVVVVVFVCALCLFRWFISTKIHIFAMSGKQAAWPEKVKYSLLATLDTTRHLSPLFATLHALLAIFRFITSHSI